MYIQKITSVLTLFFLFTLFYGCQEKKESDKMEQKREFSSPVTSSDESTSFSENSKLSEDDIAKLLGKVTDHFTTDSPNMDGQDQKNNINFQVDPEIEKKFLQERKVTIVPQVSNSTQSSQISQNNKQTKYILQYKFQPGESVRWEVIHEVFKKVTYGGKTQEVQTKSQTKRHWNIIKKAEQADKLVCEYMIDEMKLFQQQEGKEPIMFDSRTDQRAPREFAIFGTDKTIGKVLEQFVIDGRGLMTEKHKLVPEFHGLEEDSRMLVPFPETPIAIGDSWTVPILLFVKGRDNAIRTYQATEKFTLESVHGNLATIYFRTILLSVVTDPVLEAQLAEKLFTGKARFEMERGMILETELEYSKSIANAMGDMSHLDYQCHVSEKLLREE